MERVIVGPDIPYLHSSAKSVATTVAPPSMSLHMLPSYKLGNPPSTRRSYHQDGESTSSDEESDRLARNFAFRENQLSPQLVAYLCGTLAASDYLHQIVLLSQQGARSRKNLMQAVALICDTYGHVYALVPQATPAKPSLIRPIFFMIASPKFPLGTDPRMGKVGHPADLPCTSYATTLVFLDRFTVITGVNVRGLVTPPSTSQSTLRSLGKFSRAIDLLSIRSC